MAEREKPWFKVKPRAQHDVDVIIIPLVNIGREPVAHVDVTATGDHILDVSCRGRDFDRVGKVSDLGPGDRCVITVRTDGTFAKRLIFIRRLGVSHPSSTSLLG